MKNKAQKKEYADRLRTQLANVSTVILSTFQGITVEQDTQLRRSVEAAGGRYEVVKNTVAERAGEGTPAEGLLKNLKGTNSIAYTTADPVALAKALTAYAKANPTFTFRAGMVEGHVVDVSGIQALASMPPKEEIYGKLLYLINAPAQRLVTAVGGVGRNIAVVVDQGVKEGKFKD